MNLVEWLTICGLAIGLAMDAFAVSIVSGSVFKELQVKQALRMAFFFGAFQAIMPLAGYAAGNLFAEYITAWDHWIAFALLAAVGAKMIYESFKFSEVGKRPRDPSNLAVLLALSIATSIDALAVGITLSLVTSSIIAAVMVIGAITFALSYGGFELGKRIGHFFENKIEIAGGLILIGIGVKILISHLIDHGV
ncbi:MAG: manganese efflux pump MntP family protein [Planctomycetota bacterium]